MRGGHGAEAGPVGESGRSLAFTVEWVSGILSSQSDKRINSLRFIPPTFSPLVQMSNVYFFLSPFTFCCVFFQLENQYVT